MPQSKLLLDTNTYLRLAQSLHPLLGVSFGKENFTLYIHKEIELELNRSSRLQTSFYWVENEEYKVNRRKKLILSKAIQDSIEVTYDHIWQYQNEEKLKLSREDIYCIATSLDSDIPLVTDDQAMIKVCKEFDVEVLSTLQLMKIMLDNNFINFEKVIEITEYWKYENDLPANFKKDFEKLFNPKSK